MEKNNERGAGRKAHYSEKTTPVTCRVPESKEAEFKEYANKFLAKLKIKQVKGKVNVKDKNVNVNAKLKKLGVVVKESIIPNLPKQKTVLRKENEQQVKKCDCKLDENQLLRRGKIKCTLTKSQHNF